MKNKHLTEPEMQQFALEKQLASNETIEHLNSCVVCQERLSAYQLLFSALKNEKPAEFGFDLTSLVLEKMGEPAPRQRWVAALFVFASLTGMSLLVIFLYMYGNTLARLFAGVQPLVLALMATGAITTMIFVLGDMYKQYQKKITILKMN